MNDIKARIERDIKKDIPDVSLDKLRVNEEVINKIVSRTFWDSQKNKFFSMTNKNVLNAYTERSAFKHLCETNGSIFNSDYIREEADKIQLSKGETKELLNRCKAHLLDYIVVYSQRSSIEMRVDMFADCPRIEMQAETAMVVFSHVSYPVKRRPNEEIIADYKKHFPLLDEFLGFLIASRFARDRKKSFLWFKCQSDWGKGFLMGVLGELGLSVELSVKEIEKMFEGAPVGRSMTDFKHSLALVLDEFKTVKSELKQLQSTITLAPKNQLSFKAEIFAKLFFSAESVDSLVGESGVEDQFINRFNLFELKGDLTRRAVFIKHGSGAYFDSVLSYVASTLNASIEDKKKIGKAQAEKDSENYLNDFMGRHGLGLSHTRLSDAMEDMAREIALLVFNESKLSASTIAQNHILKDDNGIYIVRPAKLIENWIDDNFSFSEKVTISKKKSEIVAVLSVDGKGTKKIRIKHEGLKSCVHVRPDLYQGHTAKWV